MVYCTYSQHGNLKRAVLTPQQYEKYSKDPSVQGLQIYASQSLMESGYAQAKGINSPHKTLLFG